MGSLSAIQYGLKLTKRQTGEFVEQWVQANTRLSVVVPILCHSLVTF